MEYFVPSFLAKLFYFEEDQRDWLYPRQQRLLVQILPKIKQEKSKGETSLEGSAILKSFVKSEFNSGI